MKEKKANSYKQKSETLVEQMNDPRKTAHEMERFAVSILDDLSEHNPMLLELLYFWYKFHKCASLRAVTSLFCLAGAIFLSQQQIISHHYQTNNQIDEVLLHLCYLNNLLLKM